MQPACDVLPTAPPYGKAFCCQTLSLTCTGYTQNAWPVADPNITPSCHQALLCTSAHALIHSPFTGAMQQAVCMLPFSHMAVLLQVSTAFTCALAISACLALWAMHATLCILCKLDWLAGVWIFTDSCISKCLCYT